MLQIHTPIDDDEGWKSMGTKINQSIFITQRSHHPSLSLGVCMLDEFWMIMLIMEGKARELMKDNVNHYSPRWVPMMLMIYFQSIDSSVPINRSIQILMIARSLARARWGSRFSLFPWIIITLSLAINNIYVISGSIGFTFFFLVAFCSKRRPIDDDNLRAKEADD